MPWASGSYPFGVKGTCHFRLDTRLGFRAVTLLILGLFLTSSWSLGAQDVERSIRRVSGGESGAGAESRLVIGNGKYEPYALPNPANDARGFARLLRSLDFDVRESPKSGTERESDPSPVYGRAGWNQLQQAKALAAFYLQMKEEQGWPAVERRFEPYHPSTSRRMERLLMLNSQS